MEWRWFRLTASGGSGGGKVEDGGVGCDDGGVVVVPRWRLWWLRKLGRNAIKNHKTRRMEQLDQKITVLIMRTKRPLTAAIIPNTPAVPNSPYGCLGSPKRTLIGCHAANQTPLSG
ncbi:hypothetical protein Tco_0855884 [Tanacetum coccineum]